jgi:oligosaccharide repeat unit polymerase
MIVSVSYVIAALAIYSAGLYISYRLKLYLTASSMLLGFLLFVYGPTYLAYMLLRRPVSVVDLRISDSLNFNDVVISLNLSIAITFVGVIAGMEFVDRLAPRSAQSLRKALSEWNLQPLSGGGDKPWPLLFAILALSLFMLWISLKEGHLAIIAGFLSVSGSEVVKTAYRQQYGGSQVYLYNVVVSSVAPVMVIWGVLSGWIQRWWPLLAVAALLAVTTVLGKVETLSKAPIALFLLQLMLVAYLVLRNNINWRVVLGSVIVTLIIFYPIIRLAVPQVDQMEALSFFYYRAFDVSNQALLEYFAAFPDRIPHMWGANVRPVAAIWGLQYTPSFDVVSRLWRFSGGSTTTAMFIADAWADFSYIGVIGFSIAVGIICRTIDIVFLARGKTVTAVAVLAAAFVGIYNLMISALPTSMLSGGLILPPLLLVVIVEGQKLLRMTTGTGSSTSASTASPRAEVDELS